MVMSVSWKVLDKPIRWPYGILDEKLHVKFFILGTYQLVCLLQYMFRQASFPKNTSTWSFVH